jgi:hypothetical protein
MIKLERTEVMNWEGAIRGMRNPMNSWEKSDSYYTHIEDGETLETAPYEFFVGDEDKRLMRQLRDAGSDHRKYLRMIFVSVDITAPLYWWKEYDTYKVGTVANSCSTMHKIHAKAFERDDFSHDRMSETALNCLDGVIAVLEETRQKFLETKDRAYWHDMIQLLPSSYNQMRTCTMNYENLINMYHARRNHKLAEWHTFCDWVESLPHSDLITGKEG